MFRKLNLFPLTVFTTSVIFLYVLISGQRSIAQPVYADDSCISPPSGMIGWWPGDGNGEDIRGGNDGTLINGTSYISGTVDRAFSFDGIDDGVLVPDSASHNFGAGADFSLDAWIRITPDAPNPPTGHFTILSKRAAPTPNGMATGFELYLYEGKLGVQLADDSSTNGLFRNSISSHPDLRDENFHHVAVTIMRDADNGGHLFVDGQIVLTFDTVYETGDLSTTEPLRIGIHATDGFDAFFNGLIDEVGMYNRALAADEINAIYESGTAGMCKDGPVTTDCAAQTDIPKAECDTLLAFYNSTDGPNWTTNTGWNVTNTPCSWDGMTCNAGRVQSLILDYNQLSGSLPNISALANLKYLELAGNQLNGAIPDLSALTELQGIDLSENQLSGSIPNLSTLTSLRFLYLNENQLSNFIPELSALTNLHLLRLNNNQLSGPIPDLSALTGLEELALQNNQLNGAIPNLSTLISLADFRLHNNQLDGAIPNLTSLINLQLLFLHNNQLSGNVPTSICSSLIALELGYNKLDVNTADSCVDTADPDWKETQTVPPTNVVAVTHSSSEIQLTWDPIAYTQDGGEYGVWGKAQGDSYYTLMMSTPNKTSLGTIVSDLQSGTTYEFVIRTVTPAHGDQQNELTSVDSEMVTAVTTTELYTIFLPLIVSPASFNSVTMKDTSIPARPATVIGEVFYTTTINIGANLPASGKFYLSSAADAPVAAKVDDEVALILNGVTAFTYKYGQPGLGVQPALVEVPRSVMEQIAGKTITIEFRDVYGDKVSATALYLIWAP